MILNEQIEAAVLRWNDRRLDDEDLDDAWAKVYHMMFSGSLQSIRAGLEIIHNMDWYDALAKFVVVDGVGNISIKPHIPMSDRPVLAFTIVSCLQREEASGWIAASYAEGSMVNLIVLAAGLDILPEVPKWLEDILLDSLLSMAVVTGGRFQIGNPTTGAMRDEQIRVESIDSFQICKFPVVQFLYHYLTGENPSGCLGWLNPVDTVSWLDAVHFCNHLSEVSGLQKAYSIGDRVTWDRSADGYRLATEVEWEIAAKGEALTSYAGGESAAEVALYSAVQSTAVGRLKSNDFGLFDMSGNIWEWCWDRDQDLARRKGGSWMSTERASQVWFRSMRRVDFLSPTQGFRVCRNIEIPPEEEESTEESEEEFWNEARRPSIW